MFERGFIRTFILESFARSNTRSFEPSSSYPLLRIATCISLFFFRERFERLETRNTFLGYSLKDD